MNYNYELKTNRIKETRIKRNITQKELAEALNLQPSNLSKYSLKLPFFKIKSKTFKLHISLS